MQKIFIIAVCIYCLVMIGKELSKKFNPHAQMVTEGADIIVIQIVTLYQFILTTDEKTTVGYTTVGAISQEATWDEISTLGYFYYQEL